MKTTEKNESHIFSAQGKRPAEEETTTSEESDFILLDVCFHAGGRKKKKDMKASVEPQRLGVTAPSCLNPPVRYSTPLLKHVGALVKCLFDSFINSVAAAAVTPPYLRSPAVPSLRP